KQVTASTREKISKSTSGRPKSEEHRTNMRKPKSEIHRANIGRGQYGKPKSEAHRVKLSLSQKDIPRGPHKLVKCPHCKTVGGENAMPRWHFDNCKFNSENIVRIKNAS
ncbi:MAG: hypothetical protein ABSA33_05230, partial [Candidatus Micrarchaeaceae archaeon]